MQEVLAVVSLLQWFGCCLYPKVGNLVFSVTMLRDRTYKTFGPSGRSLDK